MILLPPAVRIFVATRVTDMRLSFDRLAAITREILLENPTAGHLFVFRNRRGDKAKILWWAGGGFCLWYIRLEEGTFDFPDSDEPSVQMTMTDLAMILDGIDLRSAKRRKRYVLRREQPAK